MQPCPPRECPEAGFCFVAWVAAEIVSIFGLAQAREEILAVSTLYDHTDLRTRFELADASQDGPDRGVVYKKTIGHYHVHTQGRVLVCTLSNKLHKLLIYPTADPNSRRQVVQAVKELDHSDPVAIGDQVRFVDAGDGRGVIIEVLPRRTRLTRRSAMTGAHPFEQTIMANADQVLAVLAAANPAPKWNLLDRYLVSAEASGIPALILLTKIDLVQDEDGMLSPEIAEALEAYNQLGYRSLRLSSVTGQGLDDLRQALAGKVSVLVGKSGVGKSSLLNAVEPGLGLRVSAVSQATGKGRHTTSNLEMFDLPFGGAIVDTPGMREFGLWDVAPDDLGLLFPEIRPLIGRCRFGLDCQHLEEPGCAIRKAVNDGQVSVRRYQSYIGLREEL